MPIKTKPSGPIPADVMIVGEAPGAEEEIRGIPFVGGSGQELTRMLHEAGFVRTEAFLTNVCKYRPPNNEIGAFFLDSKQTQPNELIKEGLTELAQEIATVRPKLILALGNTALWALSQRRGITKWRGSMLYHRWLDEVGGGAALLMPTYHPALIMREWSYRSIAVQDMRRARLALDNGCRWPELSRNFLLRPSFQQAMEVLDGLIQQAQRGPLRLASDVETRSGYIACHGIAWSSSEAICIPFMCVESPDGYWTLEEEVAIWEKQRILLTHPNTEVVGQNYLYDSQYFARRWGYIPRVVHDTLVMQNVAFPGLPRGLDFLSSMYRRHHIYWKDEGKTWTSNLPEEQLWAYNCEDAIATFEIAEALETTLKYYGLWELYQFQMETWYVALEMMFRGVRINQESRGRIASQLIEAIQSREQWLEFVTKRLLNVRSPKQVHALFYGELQCRTIRARVTKKPTCNDEALETWAREEPLLRPLIQTIMDVRSLGVLLSNAVTAPLDHDGRLRSSFDIAKESFRWSSSENAFGGGTNLQNWTKGDEDAEASSLQPGQAKRPNIRRLIIPDEGYEIAAPDLTGADAQTVAWEADDHELKDIFRENKIKIHAHNATKVWPDRCKTGYEQPYYDYIRTGIHLVNYLGQAKTLAAALNVSTAEAQWFISYWFQLHPNIRRWHERLAEQLSKTRCVYNAFGYRRFYFDRIQEILPDAVAWIGQSTTACVTNRALTAIRHAQKTNEAFKDLDIQLLFQVHDEIVLQYPLRYRIQALLALQPIIHIQVPYDDPLTIPWSLKTSRVSWGDAEKSLWPLQSIEYANAA